MTHNPALSLVHVSLSVTEDVGNFYPFLHDHEIFPPSLSVIQFSDILHLFLFLFNFYTSYKTSSVAFMDSSSYIKPMHYLMLEKHWQRV